MNFLKDDVERIYRKYLVPTLGSAVIVSVYSFVDAIAVGQYAGPIGSAAIAVINPVYILQFVIAMICASGGSVLVSIARGAGRGREGNNCFTVSVIAEGILIAVFWILLELFTIPILQFLGADEAVLPSALEYGEVIIHAFPVVILPDFLSAYLRIDHEPRRAFIAVVTGSMLNIFLDWLLVFPMNMGLRGAALATVIGNTVQDLIMLSHFFSKKNTMHLCAPENFMRTLKNIMKTGASSSLLDLGNVVLLVAMNHQVFAYGGPDAMAAWGVINTTAVFAHALFAGVGQAIQPAVAANYGAGNRHRIRQFREKSTRTVLVIAVVFTLLGELFPQTILNIFMDVDEAVLQVGPKMIRTYFLALPFLSINVLSTYFLQSVLKTKVSTWIAMSRSFLMPLAFLSVLPLFFQEEGVISAVPVSEFLVFLFVSAYFVRIRKQYEQ